MKMMKKIILCLFLVLMMSVFVSAIPYYEVGSVIENWESYNEGVVSVETSIWDSYSNSNCYKLINGSHFFDDVRSIYYYWNDCGSYSQILHTDNFDSVNSGVVNVWVEMNLENNIQSRIYLTNNNSTLTNESVAIFKINNNGNLYDVWNGTAYNTFTQYAGQSAGNWVANTKYARIRVDFDNGIIDYFQYNKSMDFLAQHSLPAYVIDVNSFSDFSYYATHKIVLDDIWILIGNDLPVVSNVDITPIGFDVLNTLHCNYSFVDANLDEDYSKIQWFVNDVERISFQNLSSLSSGQFLAGDTIECRVTGYDEVEFASSVKRICVEGGSCSSVGEPDEEPLVEENLTLSLKSTISNADWIIHDIDVNEDASMMVFVGYNQSSGIGFVGAVDMISPTSFSSDIDIVELDFEPYSVDISFNWVWVSGYDSVALFTTILNSDYLTSVDYSYNITSYDTLFREVVAHPDIDGVGYACQFDLTGSFNSDGIVFFNLTGTGDLDYVEYFVNDDCRGLDIRDNFLFVDSGQFGVKIYQIESDYNLTLVSSFDDRTYFSTLGGFAGRSDMSNVYLDTLFTHDGGGLTGVEESIKVYDVSVESSPSLINSVCSLPNTNSDVASIQPLSESLVLLVDDSDSSLYICDMSVSSSDASLLWDNPNVPSPFGEDYGRKLESYSDGLTHYLYTHSIYGEILAFEFTTFDVSVNQLPYFVSGTPDSQFVDNLNPITTNVTPIGLETSIVNVYPLFCVAPNLYDCSVDFESDTISFAVDKDSDGNIDYAWTSIENVQVTYDEPGLKDLKIYITDSEHPDDYSTSKIIVINVSGTAQEIPENFSTLKFRVRDSLSDELLSGVEVRGNLEDDVNTSLFGYTNANGELTEITFAGVYLVSFDLEDYVYSSNYFSTSTLVYEVYLQPISPEDKRILTLNFKDLNGTAIPYVFTELFMPITNSFDFKVSDAGGTVTFNPDEDNVIVGAEKDGYGSIEFDISVPLGSNIVREIILGAEAGVSSVGLCQDYIPGVLFCGMERISCSVDADCSTDRCDDAGHCSNFNWSLCDESGMDRGNRCFVKYTGGGVIKNGTNWLLDNFLYVMVIVFVAVFIVVIFWNTRR